MGSLVDSHEAKTRLPQLLERVVKRERILITKHGVHAAMLVPAPAVEKPDIRAAVEAMKRFREEHGQTLGEGLTTRELIEEGRRS